jgi:hypothetical protein
VDNDTRATNAIPDDWIGQTVIDRIDPRPHPFKVEEIGAKNGEVILLGEGFWCFERAARLSADDVTTR